ncbi:sugar kinase [Pelagicoccus sp. SDUM812005]|uniref:sugar kinase n=1 Tax=Pelagicoccus sp. SDUM812005 TaxID=3041257 RepID=UPI00280EE346|nr:sugar kinase [Pelagicoccus sp. SDUM812005]MDQ8179158.1 sugar kinase [Pelagicoccus sp. SDUM812005]
MSSTYPAGEKDCRFDCVSLGEVMLRFDPGCERIRETENFHVWEGGGEYNVSRSLSRCFGMKTTVVTALVDNEIGRLLERLIEKGRVDTSFIRWIPFDGTGMKARNGLNFTERGFGLRGAIGVSDRGHTAAASMQAGDVDWKELFERQGARWLHVGGIFAALGPGTAELTLEACRAAKAAGAVVSCDLNYRSSLWERDGFDAAKVQETLRAVVAHTDYLLGSQFDYEKCLGLAFTERAEGSPLSDEALFRASSPLVAERFPNLRALVMTLRKVRSASVNDWAAIGLQDGRFVYSREFQHLEILDRVGGGDGFASGLIYGLMRYGELSTALDYGIAHGALSMTTPGDTSIATLREVESLLSSVPDVEGAALRTAG